MILNSSAHKKVPVRERFSHPAAVAGIVLGFLLLLLSLYPEQSLHRLMVREGNRSSAGRIYLEAALRSNPGDHQLRLALAQAWLTAGSYDNARAVLDGFSAVLPEEMTRQADQLRYTILREHLLKSKNDRIVRDMFLAQSRRLLQAARSRQELARLEYDAASFSLTELAVAARQRQNQLSPLAAETSNSLQSVEGGHYREDAAAAFAAMQKSEGVVERRALFLKGVQILQSGNLVEEALQEGKRHLALLSHDKETLVVMTRIALAAGKPEQAELFIRRALGMGNPL